MTSDVGRGGLCHHMRRTAKGQTTGKNAASKFTSRTPPSLHVFFVGHIASLRFGANCSSCIYRNNTHKHPKEDGAASQSGKPRTLKNAVPRYITACRRSKCGGAKERLRSVIVNF